MNALKTAFSSRSTGSILVILLLLTITVWAGLPALAKSEEMNESAISSAISSANSSAISSANSSGISFRISSGTFEGSITLSRYTVRADGSEYWVSSTPLLIHPNFILLVQSEGGSVELLGNIRAEGIIVRQVREDFVFLTPDQKAVIMTRQELQQMITMFDSMRGRSAQEQAPEPEITFNATGEKKEIEGYGSEKWIAKQEGSSSEWHFWVTDELSIPWGLLSEQWLTKQLSLSGLPAERWFVDEKLPVRAELWSNGELAEIIKIKDINPHRIPESRFQIPAEYQRITFQQMLFDRMRNR